MSDFAVKGADLKKILKIAKKGPIAFAYNPGKTDDSTFFGMHRTKAPSLLGKAAKAEGEGKKFTFGTAVLEGKELRLTPEREMSQMAKRLKKFLKSQKVTLNVVIVDEDGTVLDSDVETDLPDDPEMAGDDAVASPVEPATLAAGSGDDPEKPKSAVPNPDDAAPDQLAARWQATADKLSPLVANAASKAIVDPTKLRAAWAMAQDAAKKGDFAAAMRIGVKVAELIKKGGGDRHKTTDAADPNIAKWELAKSKLDPIVAQTLKNGSGDVAKIRAVWAFAQEKADKGDHPAALQSLNMLAKLLAAAKTSGGKGPDEVPQGTVQAATDDLASGKALLSELRALLDKIKAALTILPSKAKQVKADVAATQSAASGNDLEAGKSAVERIKSFLAEAEAAQAEITRRRAEAMAALAALKIDPAGINESEKSKQQAQRQAAQTALTAELPSFPELDLAEAAIKTLGDLFDATKARIAETVRRRDAALVLLQSLASDPDGSSDDEKAAHLAQRLIVQKVLDEEYPAQAGLGAAEAALKSLGDVIDKTKARIAETLRRRDAVISAMKTLTDPEGATEAENATHAIKRSAVTDLLKDPIPSESNVIVAEANLVELRDVLGQTDSRITETKRRRAEVEGKHKALEADIAKGLAFEGETKLTQKLQRKLSFQEQDYAKQMALDAFDKAEAALTAIKSTVDALKAEEAEVEKAKVLRDKLLAEYKQLEPKLKTARTMYKVSAEFAEDFDTFSHYDYLVSSGIKNREYAQTFARLDVLKAVTEKLIARKAEFDQAAQRMATAKQKMRAAFAKKAGIDRFVPLLPDLKIDCETFQSTLIACKAAYDKLDLEACITNAEEAVRLSDAILARNDENNAESTKQDEARRRFSAVNTVMNPALALDRVAPGFTKLMEDYEASRSVLMSAFNTDKNFTQALTSLTEMETQQAQLAARKAENAAAIQMKADALAAYGKAAAGLDLAKKVKVYTAEGLAAKDNFNATYQVFVDAYQSGADNALTTLATAEAAAKVLRDLELAELTQRGAAKKAMEVALAALLPDYRKAVALAEANRPALDADNSEMSTSIGVYNSKSKAKGYFEATEALAKARVVIDRMLAAKANVETATGLLKPQFEAQWTDQVKADIATVLTFNDVMLPDLPARLDAVFAHDAKIKRLEAKELWHEGKAEIAKMMPILSGLMAQKALIEQKMADLKWLNDEYKTDKVDLNAAGTIEAATRELKPKVDEFNSLSREYFALKKVHEYTKARAIYPSRLAAAKALVPLKAKFDAVKAEYDAADAAWALISADNTAASKFKPITDELAALQSKLSDALGAFRNAYFGFDYVSAAALCPAIGVAARAVIAAATAKVTVTADDGSESEIDSYDKIAADVDKAAADTEAEVEALSPVDLKNTKSGAEKVAMLKALRGQKEKLTDKQRELQRKIYAAMDLDPEFVTLDDQRRAELTEAIKADKELIGAKDNWATTDIPKRIALLQKTLVKECSIYGMPVPTVQTFEEPMPGDLGSFNPGTNVIRINVHPSATFDDFYDTIDTVVHENAHNYQDYLVTRLNEGLIQPGDPEYKQAVMFASNSVAQSYVNGEEDHAIYEKQPLEEHAWKTGDGVKYALTPAPSN